MKKFEFEAVIQQHEGMNAAYIEFPYSVEEAFQTRGRVKVKATFDGYEYRGSLVNMGLSSHCIGVTQKIRKAIGKEPGNTISVVLQEDTEPRVVEVPEQLAKAFKQNETAAKFYEQLSYSRQKAYATWITSAKREDTKSRRLKRTIQLLNDGVNSPY